jgi:hypothetical protein
MGASEVRDAVRAAMSAFGDKLVALFDCTTFDEEEGVVTVMCTGPRGGPLALPKVITFTVDLVKYPTFDAVRRATIDRFCDYLLNGPKAQTA